MNRMVISSNPIRHVPSKLLDIQLGPFKMKTEVIMNRPFMDTTIRQMSKSGYFCATDITSLYNSIRVTQGKLPKRLTHYFEQNDNIEFMDALCKELNLLENTKSQKTGFNPKPTDTVIWTPKMLKQVKRGKGNTGTWMQPYLFVDYAQWLSPEFRAKVAIWVGDNLLLFRNSSGSAFKECNIALDKKFNIGNNFNQYVKVAQFVATRIMGNKEPNQWDGASALQLKERDELIRKIEVASQFGIFTGLDDLLQRV